MKIKILPKAIKSLCKLPKSARENIVLAIEDLGVKFPNCSNLKKLTAPAFAEATVGRQPGYRKRVGDYRILFVVQDNELIIARITHRRDAYR